MRIQGLIILFLLFTLTVSAQSNRTKELEKQRKALSAEIESTNKLLNENQKSITGILSRLNLVIQQINARKQLVAVLEKEMAVLNEEIQVKETQIKKLDQDLKQKKEKYAISVQKMYKQKNNQDQLLFILSADNLAQSFRRMLYLKEYTIWRRKQTDEIWAQQHKVIIEKQALLAGRAEKEALANLKKSEEEKLHQEEDANKTQVAGLQKNAKKLQAEIDKKKNQAAAMDKEIARIIAEEVAKAKKAAKAEPKTVRKAETEGGYAMTKEEQTMSVNFVANKGKLPFPLKGNYRIISRFGQQQYGDSKTIRYNSNGIELKTNPGNTAKAVFNGIVTRVFVVPGFQNSIIIRHGNYLTLYSYIEEVYVKQGDTVKTGQDIGKIYTDKEDGDATVLHFELWKEQTKLNPEPWLSK
jgi:septal ring factor EnvC (AmiA/AmiB activator)